MMKIIIKNDYRQLSKEAALFVKKRILKNPKIVLGLATGSTPLGLYQELKIAYIQKFFQEAFWVNKGMGGFMAYRDGGAGFDFIGGIVETKSPIFMECKSTAESHLEIGQEKTGLKIHQVKDMFMLEELGFEVYLLWQLRKAEIVYKITPKQILNLIGETKRLNIMNCQENHTPIIVKVKHENNWYYDFLNKLE